MKKKTRITETKDAAAKNERLIRSELCAKTAYRLLARQQPRSIYSLASIDLRRLVLDGVKLDSFERFSQITGNTINFNELGATFIYREKRIILYKESAPGGERRLNWTIAHEAGHVLLCHAESTRLSEAEADIFASELLMPEPAVRKLDLLFGERLSPLALTVWFNVSLPAARLRRAELDRRQYRPSEAGQNLITLLFPPQVFSNIKSLHETAFVR